MVEKLRLFPLKQVPRFESIRLFRLGQLLLGVDVEAQK